MPKEIRLEIKEELEEVLKSNKQGLLRPNEVVDYARDNRTTLHTQFEWDDEIAGEQYRLQQARQVIAVFTIPSPKKGSRAQIREFVSLEPDRKKEGGGYRPTLKVLSNKEHRKQLLLQSLKEFNNWHRKYSNLKELKPVFEAGHPLVEKHLEVDEELKLVANQ